MLFAPLCYSRRQLLNYKEQQEFALEVNFNRTLIVSAKEVPSAALCRTLRNILIVTIPKNRIHPTVLAAVPVDESLTIVGRIMIVSLPAVLPIELRP